MAVYIPIPDDILDEKPTPSLTYRLDFENGRIAGRVNGVEAVLQSIKKILLSPRFKCLIYGTDYGCEIADRVIAEEVTDAYISAEVENIVMDALSVEERITSITDFSCEIEEDILKITFHVSTVFGDAVVREEINV